MSSNCPPSEVGAVFACSTDVGDHVKFMAEGRSADCWRTVVVADFTKFRILGELAWTELL